MVKDHHTQNRITWQKAVFNAVQWNDYPLFSIFIQIGPFRSEKNSDALYETVILNSLIYA